MDGQAFSGSSQACREARNNAGPLHHARNVNLNPPFLEFFERHSIRTLQDTEYLIGHGACSTGADQQLMEAPLNRV
jgi:hypothetical protein